jgi:sporulation protein YlmC with PRC-barrel domain
MKRNLNFIIGASAASLMAFSSLAQEAPNTKSGGTEITQEHSTNAMRGVSLGRVEKASTLIGMEVRNYEGQKLGKVDELGVDLETGRIVQVILSTGGFLRMSVLLVPVPPGALFHDAAKKFIQLKADKAKLRAAPSYGMSNWAELGRSNQVAEVYLYHGQRLYFAERYQPELGPDPTARLGYVQRTTKLIGASVKNVQKETLGQVKNLMVDLSAGRVVAVILSSGGVFGVGEALCAVPSAAFQFNSEETYLQLDVSKEVMSKAPHFKPNAWPNFGDPSYVAGVYRTYLVEPYFTADLTTVVGPTVRNAPSRTSDARGLARP